jgi:peptidyl-tRNA hydrolase
MAQWVLSTFKDQDAEQIRSAVQRAAKAVDAVITQGMDKAMNEYNHG